MKVVTLYEYAALHNQVNAMSCFSCILTSKKNINNVMIIIRMTRTALLVTNFCKFCKLKRVCVKICINTTLYLQEAACI